MTSKAIKGHKRSSENFKIIFFSNIFCLTPNLFKKKFKILNFLYYLKVNSTLLYRTINRGIKIKINKDENGHRYAVRGNKIDKEREREREREREKEREKKKREKVDKKRLTQKCGQEIIT